MKMTSEIFDLILRTASHLSRRNLAGCKALNAQTLLFGRILNKVWKVAFQELNLIPVKNVYWTTDWLKAVPSSSLLAATLNRGAVRELRFILLQQQFSNILVSGFLLLKIENFQKSFVSWVIPINIYLEIGLKLKSEIKTEHFKT